MDICRLVELNGNAMIFWADRHGNVIVSISDLFVLVRQVFPLNHALESM